MSGRLERESREANNWYAKFNYPFQLRDSDFRSNMVREDHEKMIHTFMKALITITTTGCKFPLRPEIFPFQGFILGSYLSFSAKGPTLMGRLSYLRSSP